MGFHIHIGRTTNRFGSVDEQSEKKMGWGGMIFVVLFFLVFTSIQGSVMGSSAAATKGETPVLAQVHGVKFEGNTAYAAVSVPGITGRPAVDLGDNYQEIADLANMPNAEMTVIRHKEKGFVPYQADSAIMMTVFGFFTMLMATIFSALMSPIKVRKWRMIFPTFLVALLWGYYLYHGTFQPLFLAQALPVIIGWLILSRSPREKGSRLEAHPIYSPKYTFFLLLFGLVFGGVAFGLQTWMLNAVRSQITFLSDCRQTPVRAHLSKKETSSGGRRGGSSTTYYLLVSYAKEDGSRHYTVVTDGDTGGLFKKEVRDWSKNNFRRLYRYHNEVMGTVSASQPDKVYLCPVTQKDTCLTQERLKDFGIMHFLRLFATPFLLVGLFCIGGAIVPGFLKRERVSKENNTLPQVTLRIIQWVMFPVSTLFALYQILSIQSLLTAEMNFPLVTGLTIAAAPVVALIALFVSLKHVKKTGRYRIDYDMEPMGMTFTITPPQTQPPVALLDEKRQTAVSFGPNQWRITWADRPRKILIVTRDKVTFHL